MPTDRSKQVMPSFSPMKDVSAAPTKSANPKSTLETRPGFKNSANVQPGWTGDAVDAIDDAGQPNG